MKFKENNINNGNVNEVLIYAYKPVYTFCKLDTVPLVIKKYFYGNHRC